MQPLVGCRESRTALLVGKRLRWPRPSIDDRQRHYAGSSFVSHNANARLKLPLLDVSSNLASQIAPRCPVELKINIEPSTR